MSATTKANSKAEFKILQDEIIKMIDDSPFAGAIILVGENGGGFYFTPQMIDSAFVKKDESTIKIIDKPTKDQYKKAIKTCFGMHYFTQKLDEKLENTSDQVLGGVIHDYDEETLGQIVESIES